MNIIDKYLDLRMRVPSKVKIIAVSKFKPVEMIKELYESTGNLDFGENRAQELQFKYEVLPKRIHWHFIGHLQSNKIKYVLPAVHLIHGIDSFKLLRAINIEAVKSNRIIDCLLQFHIAKEESKFGFNHEEAKLMLSSNDFKYLKHIRIRGVMGMATFTDHHEQVRNEFASLRGIFEDLKASFFTNDPDFSELSMGMSGDYQIAIEEGSTIIRIGSLIFGEK